MPVKLYWAIAVWPVLPMALLRVTALLQGVDPMITIHRDALLIAPAAVAVCFMLWFLVMLWKEEHHRRYERRKAEKRIELRDSSRSYAAMSSMRYSGRQ